VILGPAARVAFYYAPAEDDPLHQAGSAWLGRDAATGAACAQPDVPDIAEVTREAGRYGFHATLKPPMRLRQGTGWDELRAAAAAIAAAIPPFPLPPLQVADLAGFLALRETAPCQQLQACADACVAGADHLRAPPEPEELARRQRGGLAPAEQANLARWGYQYAFATWFFHMTLTRRLSAGERARYRPAAEAHFASALVRPRMVTDLCLFVQPGRGEAFVIAARIPLAG
jgi:putative phosphonate metabolism protein